MVNRNLLFLTWAIFAIIAGYLVYFFARAGVPVAAIPEILYPWVSTQPEWIGLSGWLPGFFHTYAFILFTFVVLGIESSTNLYKSMLLWVSVESFFEIGQYPTLSRYISEQFGLQFADSWIAQSLGDYFIQGTFDPLDLLAILLAAFAAKITFSVIHCVELRHA